MYSNNRERNGKLISEEKKDLSQSKAEVASEIGLHDYENQDKGKNFAGQNESAGEFLIKHIIASNND